MTRGCAWYSCANDRVVSESTANDARASEQAPGAYQPGVHRNVVQSGRDVGLDALRGIAVAIMVGANMAPYLLPHDYPFWFRVYASLAAPLFIGLSGFMAGRVALLRTHSLGHHLKRTLALLVVAAVIDWACWGLVPFTTFDVLYLLALLQLVSRAFANPPTFVTLGASLLILAATAPLQLMLGYRQSHGHWGLDLIQSWLIDGWFPAFPWLGLGLLGVYFGKLGPDFYRGVSARLLAAGLIMLSVGGAWWVSRPPSLALRGGYAELFYPPTPMFLVTTLGVLSLAFALVPLLRCCREGGVLVLLGRRALLIYTLHLFVIARILHPFFQAGTALRFVWCYLGLLALLWILAWGTTKLWPHPRSFVARLLLG